MVTLCYFSNISNAKIGPLFYFTLNVESLYNKLQSLLRKLPTDENGDQTYLIFGFWYKYHLFWSELFSYIILAGPVMQIGMFNCVILSLVIITELFILNHSFFDENSLRRYFRDAKLFSPLAL